MRWFKKIPQANDERVKTFFAWFPITLESVKKTYIKDQNNIGRFFCIEVACNETRWLEVVTVEYSFIYCDWFAKKFVDKN